MALQKKSCLAIMIALSGLASSAAAAADILAPPQRQGYGVENDTKDGVYVALRGGYNSLDDSNYVYSLDPLTGASTRATTTYKSGYTYSGALGYDFGEFTPGFGARIEAEVGYLTNAARSQILTNSLTGATGFTQSQAQGTTNATTGLVNYYVDILLGRFKPFVTLGLGVTNVNFSNHIAGSLALANSSRVTWAWAGGGGLGFDVTDNITLEATYRYLELRDVQVTSAQAVTTKTNLRNQQATVGVRVRF